MHSITGVSWGTLLGTRKAANGVCACGSNATTSIVCCTLVDICVIIENSQMFIKK